MLEWGGIALLAVLAVLGLPMLLSEWKYCKSRREMKRCRIEVDHKDIK